MSLEKGLQELSEWATTLPPGSNKLGHNRDSNIVFQGDHVYKRGGRSLREAQFIKFWPDKIGPRIFQSENNFYKMEKLLNIEDAATFKLSTLERKLQILWQYEPFYGIHPIKRSNWRTHVSAMTGLNIPSWLKKDYCLIHGDSTIANCMLVPSYVGLDNIDTIRLIDPCPPNGNIPSFRDVDRGKMLQSYIGWEWVFSGKLPPILDIEIDVDAIYWLMVHCFRIRLRELTSSIQSDNHQYILQWAEKVISFCQDVIR